MRWIHISALSLSIAIGLLPLGLPAQEAEEFSVIDLPEQQPAADAVPGEIIVKLREDADRRTLLPAEAAGILGLQAQTRTTSGGEAVYQIAPTALIGLGSLEALDERVGDVVDQLNARDDVDFAQLNWIVRSHLEPDDTHYDKQWHYWNNGTAAGESPGALACLMPGTPPPGRRALWSACSTPASCRTTSTSRALAT